MEAFELKEELRELCTKRSIQFVINYEGSIDFEPNSEVRESIKHLKDPDFKRTKLISIWPEDENEKLCDSVNKSGQSDLFIELFGDTAENIFKGATYRELYNTALIDLSSGQYFDWVA